MTHYLLLMRHAKHEAVDPLNPEKRKLAAEGLKETKDVVEKLAELIRGFKNDKDLGLNVNQIWRAETSEVVETTKVTRQMLGGKVSEIPFSELNPTIFNPYKNTEAHTRIRLRFIDWTRESEQNKVVLLIGHQPFLSWLGHELSGNSIPLVHSEMACLAFATIPQSNRVKGQLRWILSPSTKATTEDLKELKEKIKSKMEIAKLLGAAITAVLAFLLGYLVDGEKVAPLKDYWGAQIALLLSTIAFLVAIVLFFATMYAYDRLLMPKRFWGETRPPRKPNERPAWLVWRPPSSDLWVLYQNMMRIWRYLFNGATYAVILGMLLLAYSVFHPKRWWTISLFWAGSFTGALVFWLCYHHLGPRLGAED